MTIISRVQYEMENEKGGKIETEIWKVYTLRHYMYHSFEITTQSGSGGWGRCPACPRTFTVISVHHTQIVGLLLKKHLLYDIKAQTVCVGLWVSISQLPTADGYCENCFICYRVLVIFSLLGQFVSISVDWST